MKKREKKKAKVKNTKFMGVDSNMDGCMLSSLSVKNRPSEPHANRSSHFRAAYFRLNNPPSLTPHPHPQVRSGLE